MKRRYSGPFKLNIEARVLSQFTQIVLEAPKPNLSITIKEFTTIGDHILYRRNELGLHQKDIAHILKVSRHAIHSWETRRCQPQAHQMTAIIEFLGYVPYSVPRSFRRWLTQCRVS